MKNKFQAKFAFPNRRKHSISFAPIIAQAKHFKGNTSILHLDTHTHFLLTYKVCISLDLDIFDSLVISFSITSEREKFPWKKMNEKMITRKKYC